jgi:hypothetical protein
MSTTPPVHQGACPCGHARFSLTAAPIARFYCHCLVCQRLYGAPYADVSVVPARHVHGPDRDTVAIGRHRPPPALARALCRHCGQPVLGTLGFAGLRLLTFVPSANLVDPGLLPPPTAHIFWNRRTSDHADALPRYSGYWRSELAVVATVLRAAARGA